LAQCHLPTVQAGGTLGRENQAARSDYIVDPLTPAAADVLVSALERRATSYRLVGGSILFDSYGGAVNAVGPADTAFVHRTSLACLQYVAPWSLSPVAAVVAANRTWLDETYAAMRPFVSGFAYQNYIDPELSDWQQAYYGSNLARLVGVKGRYDPTDLMRFPQGIPPP
jgi:hypothetical protein